MARFGEVNHMLSKYLLLLTFVVLLMGISAYFVKIFTSFPSSTYHIADSMQSDNVTSLQKGLDIPNTTIRTERKS